ncbi:hypothetical protein [Riemerella anatipestifer]|uniref:Uncharacterized protein n=1 Tax=Riemerella anatipestifer TaxID=34085 RepID=A0AAP3ETQ1_RIEAN|nr:hypothetical protein [Riemerella anatipestifer]MCO4304763.1 hypothetical protein [Riemerella anatipestifer]MCO7353643.1 hypothetical protein [Riemerella anatipestifer]MCQ4040118.1 hypothetical protein [Riemerella anatipestifer]MCT6761742.1 hypothetical protein [Riemerella anatipestifer]MCT6765598.1 hypothetical protein [Riemerella anatipestifer]
MKYKNIREEELKNKVGTDFFKDYDTTEIVGNIDFTVLPRQENIFGRTALLWAEAKTGNYDTTAMFVQLILTIGKARTFDKAYPPAFLGAFDGQKIAFVPYINIQDIFYLNDFNWNVTPSNHTTKEFQLIKERIDQILKNTSYVYDYETDEKELRFFIKNNIANASEVRKIKIDKNNFIPIYLRWLEIVKPTIDVDWDELKKNNILDSDFYLADIFVDDKDTQKLEDDTSIRDSLFVIYENQGYKISKENLRQMFDATIGIRNKNAYQQFWKRYKRPPITEFQEYIIERRDLLVPQDIRERKGAFFTPRKWVELSQKYLTDYLGENWQDDYYIWDCAAGTGNLLAGLTNKYNIWASTLDMADVNVMHERIDHGANLLKSHVFQFDFLNDDFSKLPQSLQDIINDEEKRKKLIIYINPPYAEAGNAKAKVGTGTHKGGTATNNKIYEKYKPIIKKASNELFAQFFARIYAEIPNSVIANFSKLKNLQSPNFSDFRNFFRAKLEKIFLVPADTFDNVKGQFPIGFFIWNGAKDEQFKYAQADVYNKDGEFVCLKNIYSYDNSKNINQWIFYKILDDYNKIGHLSSRGSNDFQGQSSVNINRYAVKITDRSNRRYRSTLNIDSTNLFITSIYFSVRHAIPATWLNDRDQFLYPNDGWQSDKEFQNDCLAFTLFHNQNRITSTEGTNHWIPFTEQEVNAQDKFDSSFMTDFIKGKLKYTKKSQEAPLFALEEIPPLVPTEPLQFSTEAQAVFQAGKALWCYYHTQPNAEPNASLYDIREYFQGRNSKGRMNSRSSDQHYTKLITQLRDTLKDLAQKITPKVYQYGFLKE